MKTRAWILFACIFLFVLIVVVKTSANEGLPMCGLDTIPRVAVISAFGAERTLLQENMEIEHGCTINGRLFETGKVANKDVVLFLSGAGMHNATMTTVQALEHFNVTYILFSGIAGGVDDNLNIGDVVIPANWGKYQFMMAAKELEDGGYGAEINDWMTNFEFWFPMFSSTTVVGGEPDVEEQIFWLAADPALLKVAAEVAASVELSACTVDNECLTVAPKIVVGGNGVSGDTFVDNARYRDWVWDTFQASALDMETADVAAVAYNYGIPYIAFRSLSDLAGGGDGANEIYTFFQLAADNSASVLLAFLEAW